MGNMLQKTKSKQVQVLMVGLNSNYGKSTTLYKVKIDEVATRIPALGYDMENIDKDSEVRKNILFTDLMAGGRDLMLPFQKQYYRDTDVLVFVVDSTERQRVTDCKYEIRKHQEDILENKSVALLVMASKLDIPGAMSIQEITEKLELHQITDKEWYIQDIDAKNSEGLNKGLSWAQSTLTNREMKQAMVKPVKEVINSVSPKPSGKPVTWGPLIYVEYLQKHGSS